MLENEIIQRLLQCKKIAVVGFSTTPNKPSYNIPRFLMKRGYTIYPVNPRAKERVNGLTFYASLLDIEEEVELVVIFRPSAEVPAIIEEIQERADVIGIWMQEGISHPRANQWARERGHMVVQDRCIYKEYLAHIKDSS